MTEKEKVDRYNRKREHTILAHSIATQVAAVENISFYGAIKILEDAKSILENNMKAQRAAVPIKIRDEWGRIIKVPEAETPSTKTNVQKEIKGIKVEITD